MKKTWLYRWFGIGRLPRRLLPRLKEEGIVIADEGMAGRLIFKNVKGPGKRYLHRSEGFSGSLAVTGKRVVCFTYGKRQINIATGDPRLAHLYAASPEEGTLQLSFESSAFREGWKGVIVLRFKTPKARRFCEALRAAGAGDGDSKSV